MPSFQRIAFYVSMVAWIGTLLPSGWNNRVFADTPAIQIVDASLDQTGTLAGALVDEHGVPIANVPIALSQSAQYLGTSTTDAAGRFEFPGLRGGTYVLSTGNASRMVRLWMHGTAPPSAVPSLTLVANAEVIRGQGVFGMGVVPLACLGMSATALVLSIILPITLSNDDEVEAS